MRDDYPAERTSVVIWLMCAIVAGFVLQTVVQLAGSGWFYQLFGLSIPALREWKLWTLFSYSLLHSGSGLNGYDLLHLIGNLLGIYFIGREVLPVLGSRRFIGVYSASVLLGGAAWALFEWRLTGGASGLVGASAGVLGLLVIYAAINPDRPITLLLFFVLPVSVRPRHLVLGLLAIELVGLLIQVVNRGGPGLGFAHSAHLGGMAAGWIYFRYFHDAEWRLPRRLETVVATATSRKSARRTASSESTAPTTAGSRTELKAEVDRILDKINSQGFAALSAEEKRLLDQAKNLLSRR